MWWKHILLFSLFHPCLIKDISWYVIHIIKTIKAQGVCKNCLNFTLNKKKKKRILLNSFIKTTHMNCFDILKIICFSSCFQYWKHYLFLLLSKFPFKVFFKNVKSEFVTFSLFSKNIIYINHDLKWWIITWW